MCMLTPHTFVLLSNAADAPTSLNAFDKALLDMGVSDYNYIKVSSILPPSCKRGTIDDARNVPPGSFMFSVMSKIVSEEPGDVISSSLACAKTNETVGCISEYSGHCSAKEAERRAIDMAYEMVDKRGATLASLHTTSSDHVVEKSGCSISLCLLLY